MQERHQCLLSVMVDIFLFLLTSCVKADAHESGETEWTINGRFSGKSELPLTSNGVEQV